MSNPFAPRTLRRSPHSKSPAAYQDPFSIQAILALAYGNPSKPLTPPKPALPPRERGESSLQYGQRVRSANAPRPSVSPRPSAARSKAIEWNNERRRAELLAELERERALRERRQGVPPRDIPLSPANLPIQRPVEPQYNLPPWMAPDEVGPPAPSQRRHQTGVGV